MRKRTIDLVLSIVASAVALLLSWPYFRSFEFWPESQAMWLFYFGFGFVIAVYVFYVFLGALHTLFEHDALEHADAAKEASKSTGGQP